MITIERLKSDRLRKDPIGYNDSRVEFGLVDS